MPNTTRPDSPLALWSVRLSALWLATGALAKLFIGTPAFLPEFIRNQTPFSLDVTYMLVIGTELALVALAFLRPRNAWWMLAGLFVFFDFILTTQIAAGEESCGCFGGQIKVSPWLMMSIDSGLLLALLASRPWATLQAVGAGLPVVVAAMLVTFVAPALYLRAQLAPAQAPEPGAGNAAAQPATPRWIVMEPDNWVGQTIYDIAQLTPWVEAEKLPTDGVLIFWRQGCSHCAEHLRALAGIDKGEQPITLVQIRDDLKDGRAVDIMPEGGHVQHLVLPENLQVMLQTPHELELSGGQVTRSLDEKAGREKLGLPAEK
ncbi:MAG: MauE/DoxX family redox-associated membrane protein [Planctomycetia bacterium]